MENKLFLIIFKKIYIFEYKQLLTIRKQYLILVLT